MRQEKYAPQSLFVGDRLSSWTCASNTFTTLYNDTAAAAAA
jgi:hypothetical protein